MNTRYSEVKSVIGKLKSYWLENVGDLCKELCFENIPWLIAPELKKGILWIPPLFLSFFIWLDV